MRRATSMQSVRPRYRPASAKARRAADVEEDRLDFALGLMQRLFAPGIPIDRVVGVLEQVSGVLVDGMIGHGKPVLWKGEDKRGLPLQETGLNSSQSIQPPTKADIPG